MAVKRNLDKLVTQVGVAAAAGTGSFVRTASGFATRTLTGPAAGITVTNGSGVAGNPTLALSNTLAALQTLGTAGTAGLVKQTGVDTFAAVSISGTGMLAQTGTAAFVTRTITGSGLATVTNGSGVSAAPDVSVSAAVQSDQETASSTTLAVTPGRQHFHPSAAKCWAYVTGDGTSLLASYNITSITDTGVGDLTIVIGTDFSSFNWASACTIQTTGASARHVTESNNKTSGSIELLCSNAVPALVDPDNYNFVGFGDQ